MLAQLLHWLVTPISGASDHAIAMPLAWHGRLMVLAMGLLTPQPLLMLTTRVNYNAQYLKSLGNLGSLQLRTWRMIQ